VQTASSPSINDDRSPFRFMLQVVKRMSAFVSRRNRLRKLLGPAETDALLVTNFKNVTYLTGFTGDDSYLLVTQDAETLVTDPRYTTQLAEECPGLTLRIRAPGERMVLVVGDFIKRSKIKRLAIEAHSATVGLERSLTESLPKVQLVAADGLVEQLRIVKDKDEINQTRLACRQAERAFDVVRGLIKPQMTERDLAAELEYQARKAGAKSLSFPAIVAVGPHAALPHATPSAQRLDASDFVLVDWGACSGLYMSDLTRIIVTGRISPKLRKVYGVVLAAQLAAIDAIRPGQMCEQIDRVARRIISKAGFGRAFGHGLGHGTGLEIHEAPRLAVGQETKLRPGMIITVEPGIYLPGWGGVRIEDDVLVTRTGHEVLSNVPKQMDDCALES
jgi:Xaa-Pro aminopeptidase